MADRSSIWISTLLKNALKEISHQTEMDPISNKETIQDLAEKAIKRFYKLNDAGIQHISELNRIKQNRTKNKR